jgi:hypothetical protein
MKVAFRLSAIALAAMAIVASPAVQAQSHHGGYGHGGYGHGYYRGGHGWGPGLVWGGIGLGLGLGLGSYYYGAPYGYGYPYGSTTYVVEPSPTVIYQDAPPVQVQAPSRSAPEPVVYPRNGQSATQTEADRQACNRWATSQPSAMSDSSVFQRATLACLEGRGYTVK